jgi:hypothetical protein
MIFRPIIVEMTEDLLHELRLDVLEEGIWRPSGFADLIFRVDPARSEMRMRRHVHIAHPRHIHAKTKQVSWDDTGHRHDRGSFDVNFPGISSARQLARQVLKIPRHLNIESVEDTNLARLLVEGLLAGEFEDAESALSVDFFRLTPRKLDAGRATPQRKTGGVKNGRKICD